MRLKATSVKALEKYEIYVTFNDGTKGMYDLNSCAGKGVFLGWERPDIFDKVFINPENNAIAWNERLEIDTLNAYLHIKNISPEEYFNSKNQYSKHL
jgi:uncharacterized protein DUF2442